MRKIFVRVTHFVEAHPQKIAFAVAFVLMLIRAWSRFRYAHVWAEDGTVFLQDAFSDPWGSLLKPYAGYFHTIPRLIALVAVYLVPIAHIPLFIASVCVVIFAAVSSTVARKEYRWLIPSTAVRILVAVLFGFSPGIRESIGNLTNLHTFLFLWLALLGLRDEKQFIFSKIDLLLAVLVIFSEGASVLLLPLLACHLIRRKAQPAALLRLGAAISVGLVLALTNVLLRISSYAQKSVAENYHFEQLGQGLASSVLGLHLIYPLAGERWFENVMKFYFPWVVLAVGGAVAVLLVKRLKRLFCKTELRLLLLFELAFLFQVFLTWYVRPGSVFYFYAGGDFLWAHRYTFLRVATGLLLLMAAFHSRKLVPSLSLLLGISFVIWAHHRLVIPVYGNGLIWANILPALESIVKKGCSTSPVPVSIYPEGWFFNFQLQNRCADAR